MYLRCFWKSFFLAALMDMAKSIKVKGPMNLLISRDMGPSSLTLGIVVAPVTAVTIVAATNTYPSRLCNTGFVFRNDGLNWKGPINTNSNAAKECTCVCVNIGNKDYLVSPENLRTGKVLTLHSSMFLFQGNPQLQKLWVQGPTCHVRRLFNTWSPAKWWSPRAALIVNSL